MRTKKFTPFKNVAALVIFLVTINSLLGQNNCWTVFGNTPPPVYVNSYAPYAYGGPFLTSCTDGNNVYLAGNIEAYWSPTYASVQQWNNNTGWTEIVIHVDTINGSGQINSMCVDGTGNLYVAGSFASGNKVCQLTGVQAFLGTGSNALNANGVINAICSDGTNIYAGGSFTDSLGNFYLAEWNGVSWREVAGFGNYTNGGPILSLCYDSITATVFAGGSFGVVGINQFGTNNLNWQYQTVTSFCPCRSGGVYALGNNGEVGSWNGTSWTIYSQGVISPATCICSDSVGNIYISGGDGQSGNVYKLAVGDTVWQPVGSGACALHANSSVNTICSFNGGIVAAGAFTISPYYYYTAYYGPYIPGPLYVYLNHTNVNCRTSGSITTSTNNGVAPIKYLWSTGDTTANLNLLSKGTYYVTVTDSFSRIAVGYATIDSNCMNFITGFTYDDLNGNCVYDSTDILVSGLPVTINSSGGLAYYGLTDANGRYYIGVPDTGIYVCSFGNISACNTPESCNNGHDTVHISAVGDTINAGYFAFTGGLFDLSLHPGWTSAIPGFQKQYWTYFFNLSSLPFTDTVTIVLNYDSNLIYQYSLAPQPVWDSAAHTLTWKIDTTLEYDDWIGKLNSYFMVPSTLSNNYLLQTHYSILPTIGDCDTTNNFFNFSETCIGSHDPNAKQVSPSGHTTSNDSILTYTIYFQNTGTDSTHFVTVTDTLSPYLLANTVVNLASSSPYTSFNITGQGVLTWVFNPLSLPDSSQDPIASTGFIIFKVKKMANLPFGTDIANTATVYFDYNTGIVTNATADTAICSYSTSFDTSICGNSGGFLFNGLRLTASGSYTDTLLSVGGCDSFVTVNLTVIPVLYVGISDTICSGDTIHFNGRNLTASGSYTDTLIAYTSGCDSITTFNLTVRPILTSAISQSICHGGNYNFNGTMLTLAGNYKDTLTNPRGCDSIVTLTLSYSSDVPHNITVSICQGNSYIYNGDTLIYSGIYNDTLVASTGCDSLVVLTLNILPNPLEPYIVGSNDTLTASPASGYQWLLNDTALVGDTGISIVAAQVGIYRVEITGQNGCKNTSAAYYQNTLGLGNVQGAYSVKLYPNPNNGSFIISFSDNLSRSVQVSDALGRIVLADEIVTGNKEFNLAALAGGVYFTSIKGQDEIRTVRFVIAK